MIDINPYQDNEFFENLNIQNERIIDIEFLDCTFENCNFENCVVRDCKFTDCKFVNCKIANLTTEHNTMMDSNFTRCYLIGVNWNTLFGGGYIMPINHLENCQLKYNNFVEMNFDKFDFSNNTITSSMFADCSLLDSKFIDCKLDNTEFFRCNLSKSDFRGALGYIIDITTNKLKDAKFSFPEVVNLLNGIGIIID